MNKFSRGILKTNRNTCEICGIDLKKESEVIFKTRGKYHDPHDVSSDKICLKCNEEYKILKEATP